MIVQRRSFLVGAFASLLAAPAIVHVANIMPVRALDWWSDAEIVDIDQLLVKTYVRYAHGFVNRRVALEFANFPSFCELTQVT